MKKILFIPLLVIMSFETHAAILAAVPQTFISGTSDLEECIKAHFTPYWSRSDCSLSQLLSTTTIPTLLIGDLESGVTSEETQSALINEAHGLSEELIATNAVASHLELTNDEVIEAVKNLYKVAEVTIQNIEIYYGL